MSFSVVKISAPTPEASAELVKSFEAARIRDLQVYTRSSSRHRGLAEGLSLAKDILIVLGSSGTLAAIVKIISKYLERHKNAELALEREGAKIVIKGHSPQNEEEILRRLFGSSEGSGAAQVPSAKVISPRDKTSSSKS